MRLGAGSLFAGRSRPSRRQAAALLICLALGAGPGPGAEAAAEPAGFAGRSLQEALLELRAGGLQIVFTSNVVQPQMRVAEEPHGATPREVLAELLAAHGLEALEGPNETLVIVPRGRAPAAGEPHGADSGIAGTVRSRRDTRPVAGVTVRVVEAGLQAVSSADGSFRISGLGPGSYTLEVRRRGFVVEQLERVVVEPQQLRRIAVLLDPAPITEERLVVTPSRLSLLREEPATPLALSRQDIFALPHLGDDPFRALSLLPGVASNDVTAQFHVRGGRRDETRILVDGQELYDSYHLKDFDSALSVVAATTLDSIDLSTGGFPVEHGDRMSGVLDMRTVTPAGPRRTQLGLSLLSAHLGSTGSFADQRGSWVAHLRRGSIDLAGQLLGKEDPSYWDAFGKLDYQLTPRQALRANTLLSGDELKFSEVVGSESKEVRTRYDSTYFWLTHQALVGDDLLVETAVSTSRVDRDRRAIESEEDVEFEILDRRELEVLGLRQGWSLQLTPRHSLKWGFELRRFETDYDYRGTRTFDIALADLRDNQEQTTLFVDSFEEDHDSVYAAGRARLGKPLTLELGLRYDNHSLTREGRLSPRLNLAWAVGERSVVRAALGRFNQSQRPYELQVEDGETEFNPVERSDSRVLGFEHLFERGALSGLALRIELFEREVLNPLPRWENLYEPINIFPEVEPDRIRITPQRSFAEGVEIFLRGELSGRLGWWANYTYSQAEDEVDGSRIQRSFDQTHAVNLDLNYRIGAAWTLNLAWRYHTGWPTTPLSVGEQVGEDGEIVFVPVPGPRFSDRLPDYHRLDLRASRAWTLRSGELVFYVDVQNAYDRGNVAGFDYEIDEQTGELIARQEEWAGILPSVGIRYEF